MKRFILKRMVARRDGRSPELILRIQHQVLLDLAAKAFGEKKIRIWTQPSGQSLRSYADFTITCMEKNDVDPEVLFQRAFELGQKLRKLYGTEDERELKEFVFALYRNIDISMSGDIPGEIAVDSCYFGRRYSPKQCAIMSHVDSGIISGIFNGGRLEFTERISEGCKECLGCFCRKDEDHE